jgi:glutaminyl-tRNA synthetase
MPTLAGLRRRGYTPEAIRDFSERIGVAKANSVVDLALLEHCVREDLNRRAARVMAVLRPVRLTIENYPEGQVEELEAVNNPEDPAMGVRKAPFSRVLWIERDDVREVPPPKYFRLYPGNEVRLRYAYIVRCTSVVKDERTGEIVEVRCTYDPASRGGQAGEGRRVKGTIHWVSAPHALTAEARLYDRLFSHPNPGDQVAGGDFTTLLNPASLEVVPDARVEPSLAGAPPGSRFQFERLGYFSVDPDTSPGRLVVNRTVGLRDTWAKIEKGHLAAEAPERQRTGPS